MRSGAFRMLREAELIDAENRVSAPRLSGALRDLLASDPGGNLYVGQVLGPNSGDVMP